MKKLIETAWEAQNFLINSNLKFCFIGGIAVQAWGEPRVTQDVDITILVDFGKEQELAEHLLKQFEPRIEDAINFSIKNRVLLAKTKAGVPIDISFAALPFEEEMIARAKEAKLLPKVKLLVCSPEDLIILKAFADRFKDWNDIETVILRQGSSNLNWDLIFKHLGYLSNLKEAPELVDKLRALKVKKETKI